MTTIKAAALSVGEQVWVRALEDGTLNDEALEVARRSLIGSPKKALRCYAAIVASWRTSRWDNCDDNRKK